VVVVVVVVVVVLVVQCSGEGQQQCSGAEVDCTQSVVMLGAGHEPHLTRPRHITPDETH